MKTLPFIFKPRLDVAGASQQLSRGRGLMAERRRDPRGPRGRDLRRLGRRRQDDHLGGARRRPGRAREEGRRAHDRPREAARGLARAEGARRTSRGRWTRSLFEDAGVEMQGELWAMMLDAKATFDELVRKHAPDEETRDRILENRIYRQISNALAGSQEYMAMEKLFEIHQEGRYDFLVLDTPPSRNALDFLDAPKRLTQFIEGRVDAGVHEADGPRDQGRRPRQLDDVRRAEAGHRARPAHRPERVLPGLQRHGGRLPGARQARQRAARRPRDHVPGRLRPAGRADRRGRLLPPQAGRGEAAGRRRDRQQGPLRDRGRPREAGEVEDELSGLLGRRPGASGSPPTSPTTRRSPSGTPATSSTSPAS